MPISSFSSYSSLLIPIMATLALALALATDAVSARETRTAVRGASPSDYQTYYYPASVSGTFTCITSGESIPFSKVNDEYCDCGDGSDEPGTSACSMVAGAKFYCVNAGDEGRWLGSGFVDDGVCDCCDGSDEGVGACRDVCVEEGKKKLEDAEKRLAEGIMGVELREEMVREGKKQREAWGKRLEVLEGKEEGVEVERVKADVARKNAEVRLERARSVVVALEKKVPDGLVNEGEGEVEGDDGDSYEAPDADATRGGEMEEVEEVEETEEERAKRVASQWIPGAGHAGEDDEDAVYEDGSAVHVDDEDSSDSSTIDMGEDSTAGFSSVISPLLSSLKMWVEGYFPALMGSSGDAAAELRAARAKLESMQKKADKAREVFRKKDDALRELQQEMVELRRKLSETYGEGDVFLELSESCVESSMIDGKYWYRVCPFGRAEQKEGGKSTGLGTWGGFEKVGDDTVMKFTNGDACWQGPRRSMTVRLRCGRMDSFENVSEPSRCEYIGVLTTPAFCSENYIEKLREEVQRRKSLSGVLGGDGGDGGDGKTGHEEL